MDPVDLIRGLEQSSVESNVAAEDAYAIATQYNETLLGLAYSFSRGPANIPLRRKAVAEVSPPPFFSSCIWLVGSLRDGL